MRRRDFLRAVTVSSGAVVLAPALWRPAGATTRQGSADGPYGSIEGREPDENGLLLPEAAHDRGGVGSGGVGVIPLGRLVGHPEPPQIDRSGAVAGSGQGWELVAPRVPELGKAMQQEHHRPVSRRGDVESGAIGRHEGMLPGPVVQQRRGVGCSAETHQPARWVGHTCRIRAAP